MKKVLFSALILFLGLGFATAQTQYYSEDFESGVPAGWTIEGEWMLGVDGDLSSQYQSYAGNATSFMAFNDDALGGNHVGGGTVTTAPIDLTAVSGTLWLELNAYFANGDYGGADETFKIMGSTDGGATYEEILNVGGVRWTYLAIPVDSYAGSMLTLAFVYDDGEAWNFGCAIDDIILAEAPINVPRKNYGFTVNGGSQFNQSGMNIDYPVQGIAYNGGYEAITSFDVVVTKDGASTTQTITGLNIGANEAVRYELPETINTGTDLSTYTFEMNNVNGDAAVDENTDDNSTQIIFDPVSVNANQAVVVEEATGTWCQWCPRGTVYLDEMSKRFGHNFVGVAVHNNDPMVLAEYDSSIGSFPGFSGYPQVIFNRSSVRDPGEIVAPSIAVMSAAPVATLELGGMDNGGVLSTSVKVTFMEDAPGANYNVTVVLTEDDISDDATTYNQVNAYSGGANGAMGGFEILPTSVPSAWWPYSHVGRALIGGFEGVNGIVGDFGAGSSPSVYMDDFTMDASWVTDNMHIIAILTDASGEVVNAISGKYADVVAAGNVSSTEDVLESSFAAIYPNPTEDLANITMNLANTSNVNVMLVDNLGRTVSTKNYGTQSAGYVKLQYNVNDVNSGIYLLQIQVNDQILTKKLTVK